ncbi:MAG: FHA domain-containing protein [Rubrivivax sp.]|nr:FHA domain-containing protein [Rubrivivax sp.]
MRALLEIIDRDGRVGRVVDLRQWPVTLGRALGNDVVIDDPFVAPQHALLALDSSGQVMLSVGDTVNGVQIGTQRHIAGQQLLLPAAGATLQIGAVRLRLRLPAETVAAEKPLPAVAAAPWVMPLVAGALVMLQALTEHALTLDPGSEATAWLPVAVGLPLAVAGWCGLWALASKLFQQRFDFLGHLRIVLPWLLGVAVVDLLLPPLAAALGWPALWRLTGPLQLLLGLLMLRAQLVHLLPQAPRSVTAVVAVAALVGAVISLTLTERATDRLSRPAYMTTLPLPWLHWANAAPAATAVQDLNAIAARLASRVQKAKADETADEAGDVASN